MHEAGGDNSKILSCTGVLAKRRSRNVIIRVRALFVENNEIVHVFFGREKGEEDKGRCMHCCQAEIEGSKFLIVMA